MDFASLGAFPTAPGTYAIDTNGPSPSLSGPGNVSIRGEVSNGIAVFDFTTINIGSGETITASGAFPLALLSRGDITINGTIDVSASNTGGGPGGGAGGDTSTQTGIGGGPGGGSFGSGGGFGGPGGTSGATIGGGVSYGDLLQTLQGGSGGGAGGIPGLGGGGGGGIEIGALGGITIGGNGILADGGAGGPGSVGASNAGGGGSGGGILIHGDLVALDGYLRAPKVAPAVVGRGPVMAVAVAVVAWLS